MDRLRAIGLFVRIVELDSVTAAARELRITQSTASKWLAALEAELGVTLLERTTRARRVTDAGEQFYARATELLRLYDAAAAEAQRRTGALRGRIRLNVPVVFGRLHIVELAGRFAQTHPEVELELIFGDRYVNLVDEGYDLALRVGLPVDSSFRSRVVGQTPRRLVAAPAYLAARETPTTPTALSEHTCLVHREITTGAVWVFQRDGEIERARATGHLSANNSAALLSWARDGFGIALLASWLVDGDLRTGRLVELLPEWSAPAASVQILMAPAAFDQPRVRQLVDFLATELRERVLAT